MFLSIICNYVAPTALLGMDTNVTWVAPTPILFRLFKAFREFIIILNKINFES